eukprot:scaffold107070_cov72-Phaeocystis_antarctica.AAC.5
MARRPASAGCRGVGSLTRALAPRLLDGHSNWAAPLRASVVGGDTSSGRRASIYPIDPPNDNLSTFVYGPTRTHSMLTSH